MWENEEAFRLSKRLNLKVDIGFILFDPFVELDEVIYNIEALLETSYFDFMYAGGYICSPCIPLWHRYLDQKSVPC